MERNNKKHKTGNNSSRITQKMQLHFLLEEPAARLPEPKARRKVQKAEVMVGLNAASQPLTRSASEWHPKIFIKTFGCQMNEYDSEILRGLLKAKSFVITSDIEFADIVLFNTCSVREHAEARVWGQVGMLGKRSTKDEARRTKIIGVIGCMAQAHKENIFDRLPQVNLVCGPQGLYDIPDYLEKIISDKGKILAVSEEERPLNIETYKLRDKIKDFSAYVTIMEGCNNFCSYCIVPFVRGRERSKPAKLIIREVEEVVKKGAKQVVLLGQNVNSYGKDFKNGYDFLELLKDVDKIRGLRRLKFITSHPKDASDAMFKVMSELPRICKNLHLPIQSGSNKILKRMNRGYTRDDYLKKIESLRKLIPDCSINTDIIVGFPGETDEDFKQTVDIMKRIRFDTSYIFKYSPRPYTQAAKLEDDVPKKIKEERNQELLKIQKEISLSNNKRLIGKKTDVLVNRIKDMADGKHLVGRSHTDKIVSFKGEDELLGKIVEVKIKNAAVSGLEGEWVK